MYWWECKFTTQNKIFTPAWLKLFSEEILGSSWATWFSKDGGRLLYATFNATKVGEVTFKIYGDSDVQQEDPPLYGKMKSLRYPKVSASCTSYHPREPFIHQFFLLYYVRVDGNHKSLCEPFGSQSQDLWTNHRGSPAFLILRRPLLHISQLVQRGSGRQLDEPRPERQHRLRVQGARMEVPRGEKKNGESCKKFCIIGLFLLSCLDCFEKCTS